MSLYRATGGGEDLHWPPQYIYFLRSTGSKTISVDFKPQKVMVCGSGVTGDTYGICAVADKDGTTVFYTSGNTPTITIGESSVYVNVSNISYMNNNTQVYVLIM